MAARAIFFFAAILVICHMIIAVPRQVREVADSASDSQKSIDDALKSFKDGIDDLLKNIQNNELFQNISSSVQQFGASVEHQSKQLLEKIQTTGGKTN